MQQREPLGPEFRVEHVHACQVTSRPIEARNKPELRGVNADKEHNWDAGGRSLGGKSRRRPGCDDHRHSKLDQISRQRRQSVGLVSRPAIFDQKVPAFNVAGFVYTSPEACQPASIGLRRPEV